MNLETYITLKHGDNQAAFARAQGVAPPQVSQWIRKGFIVVNDKLYSPRRELAE
jgi:DNA-binding transcriptional regulator YdaS (Cro superfamily)